MFVARDPIDIKLVMVGLMAKSNIPLSELIQEPAHWCIYASTGLNELTHCPLGNFNEISDK